MKKSTNSWMGEQSIERNQPHLSAKTPFPTSKFHSFLPAFDTMHSQLLSALSMHRHTHMIILISLWLRRDFTQTASFWFWHYSKVIHTQNWIITLSLMCMFQNISVVYLFLFSIFISYAHFSVECSADTNCSLWTMATFTLYVFYIVYDFS